MNDRKDRPTRASSPSRFSARQRREIIMPRMQIAPLSTTPNRKTWTSLTMLLLEARGRSGDEFRPYQNGVPVMPIAGAARIRQKPQRMPVFRRIRPSRVLIGNGVTVPESPG
jgi:hypothetical protein